MNDVQKNFKKQMNQSLKKLKKEDKDNYYNYLRKNHLHSPEQEESYEESIVLKVLRLIGKLVKTIIITLIVVAVLGIGSGYLLGKKSNIAKINTNQSVNISNINNKQNEIVSYLNTVGTIESNIIKDINSRTEDVKSLNNKKMTSKEYLSNLTVYKNRISDNIQQIDKISCPEELISYKEELQNSYGTLTLALKLEINYMQTNNKNSVSECQKQYKDFNDSSKKKTNDLNIILDKYGIKQN